MIFNFSYEFQGKMLFSGVAKEDLFEGLERGELKLTLGGFPPAAPVDFGVARVDCRSKYTQIWRIEAENNHFECTFKFRKTMMYIKWNTYTFNVHLKYDNHLEDEFCKSWISSSKLKNLYASIVTFRLF